MKFVNLKFSGQKIQNRPLDESQEISGYEVISSYQLMSSRSEADVISEPLNADVLVRLTTEDGLEWIGFADDLLEIHGEKPLMNRGDQIEYIIPEYIESKSGTRGILKFLKNKFLDLIRIKKADRLAAKQLGKLVDGRIMNNSGLFEISKSLNLSGFDKDNDERKKFLVMLHGFISTVEGSFTDFLSFDQVWNQYDGAVLGFNHYTISKSPVRNAIELLESLPSEVEVDLLSHSRGGLVADLMARCDRTNEIQGFSKDEITLIENKGHQELAEDMQKLKTLAQRKNITVGRVVRVACPASGTQFLSKRLDFFLNIFMNALSSVVGSTLNPAVSTVKNFLLEVLSMRFESSAFPGIWAMVPDSDYQSMINNNQFNLNNDLVSVVGNADLGGSIGNSIAVILSNLFIGVTQNDKVNDTPGQLRGLQNRNSHYSFRYDGKNFSHFKYFTETITNAAIIRALNDDTSNMTDMLADSIDRGVVLNIFSPREVHRHEVTGDRDILIMLPGIMGSCIYQDGERIWVNLKKIHQGQINSKLGIEAKDVTTPSAIKQFYGAFKEHFQKRFDVLLFPFDWRNSVEDSAKKLQEEVIRLIQFNKKIRIAAHSMGGLVVRSWMTNNPGMWKTLKSNHDSRVIFFGTPWRGSHLITEVLTGKSRRVKQLAILDSQNNAFDIVRNIQKYPGIYDLLPLDAQELVNPTDWNTIYKKMGVSKKLKAQSARLERYKKYREKYEGSIISDQDKDYIIYVAGWKKSTTEKYGFTTNFFGKTKIVFESTSQGDGSVTWKSGIPTGIKSENLYYTAVDHSNLMADESMYSGIEDLISRGTTNSFVFKRKRTSISTRSASRASDDYLKEKAEDYFDSSRAMERIFDLNSEDQDASRTISELKVDVFNGDLKWSKHPILVGHFASDGIVSAERAIDKYLDGKLQERHDLGFYPGYIGEQAIIYDPEDAPPGAIVVGLGLKNSLSGYSLSKTIEKGILKYAVFFRDNFSAPEHEEISQGISCLLVGSAYGRLPMQESIRSILMGIQKANELILSASIESKLRPIKHVEFVDYYRDNAYECFKVLKTLELEQNAMKIQVSPRIIDGFGNRERLLRDESRSWWQSFTTELKEDPDTRQKVLSFSSYSGLANVSKEYVYSDLSLSEYLAAEMSKDPNWDEINSKTIFELLIPNAYKDFVRNHRNIEWKMDVYTAQFPWEMFHDFNYGDKPSFTESGLIRQLILDSAEINPALVASKTALVIGDPLYGDLPQLNGALEESENVAGKLRTHHFDVELLTHSNPVQIVKSLYASEYKVLHIAAHGLFDIENGKVGIAIGEGQLLSPGTIRQLSSIPEFVFINCCYSGTISPEQETYQNNRNKLAANVGTQLIKMGVKAVVVAGWAVDDQAALSFASSLYDRMLNGAFFGDAIRLTRKEVYDQFRKTNTWGAYQCYGDQFYQLSRKGAWSDNDAPRSLRSEILLELRNINSEAQNFSFDLSGSNQIEKLFRKAVKLAERAETLNEYGCDIQELESLIYMNLGKYKAATRVFNRLMQGDCLDFSFSNVLKYFNIRSKELVLDLYKDRNSAFNKIEDYRVKIQSIIANVKKLAEVGINTPDYYSALGSTYKRMALIQRLDINADEKDKEWNFKKIMAEASANYSRAASITGFDQASSIYYITSLIVIDFLNEELNKRKKTFDGKTCNEYLKYWITEIKEIPINRHDNWSQLMPIQLLNCAYVIGLDHEEANPDHILGLYKLVIDRCISAKDLIGEIEYLSFILELLPVEGDFGERIKEIQNIKTRLEQYLN